MIISSLRICILLLLSLCSLHAWNLSGIHYKWLQLPRPFSGIKWHAGQIVSPILCQKTENPRPLHKFSKDFSVSLYSIKGRIRISNVNILPLVVESSSRGYNAGGKKSSKNVGSPCHVIRFTIPESIRKSRLYGLRIKRRDSKLVYYTLPNLYIHNKPLPNAATVEQPPPIAKQSKPPPPPPQLVSEDDATTPDDNIIPRGYARHEVVGLVSGPPECFITPTDSGSKIKSHADYQLFPPKRSVRRQLFPECDNTDKRPISEFIDNLEQRQKELREKKAKEALLSPFDSRRNTDQIPSSSLSSLSYSTISNLPEGDPLVQKNEQSIKQHLDQLNAMKKDFSNHMETIRAKELEIPNRDPAVKDDSAYNTMTLPTSNAGAGTAAAPAAKDLSSFGSTFTAAFTMGKAGGPKLANRQRRALRPRRSSSVSIPCSFQPDPSLNMDDESGFQTPKNQGIPKHDPSFTFPTCKPKKSYQVEEADMLNRAEEARNRKEFLTLTIKKDSKPDGDDNGLENNA